MPEVHDADFDKVDAMMHEQRMKAVNLAKPSKATQMVFDAVWYDKISFTEFKELLPLIDNECACEICGGAKGGTPGNENVINGMCVCDFCTNEYRIQWVGENS
jgi:hypothetical protein